ncbi:MAG TPA: MltA domain-containing protein [Xanthobacteraceae bacterium]|jgi:membrane-bound lytic murein transglycosylase A
MQTDRGFAEGYKRAAVAGLGGTILFFVILCFTAGLASAADPLKLPGSQLEPVKWSELAGWMSDDHLAAFAAYQASCRALHARARTDDLAEIHQALTNVCRKALALQPADSNTARAFFEQNFQPVRIARLGETEGLLTGYFEPVVAGSRFPGPEFPVPLYRRPRDLVAAGYRPGSTAFPNKGARIGRRNAANELVPYYDRGAIEAGALDGQKLEICWLKDPLDLLAIQIEGSGRVILEDGTPLRVSFDSHNGYGYSSFERVLVERHLIARKDMSRERIRAWMAAHPEEAAKVRATNRSYTFFRVTGLSNDGEPVGAQGVPLTPGRSIAVDRLHEYGTPFFIEAKLPIESAKASAAFGRLMIAQDTGSAIVGPARADLYLGAGDRAARIANRIRHPGRFAILLPRELDMVAAGSEMPLPVPKPKIAPVEIAKQQEKSKPESAGPGASADARHSLAPTTRMARIGETGSGKQDARGKSEPASAGVIAHSRHSPAPPTPSKTGGLAARKQDGRAKSNTASTAVVAAGRHSPTTKTKMGENAASTQDGGAKSGARSAGVIAVGRHAPAPTTKTKTGETGAAKQDGKPKPERAGTATIVSSRHPSAPTTKTGETTARKQDAVSKAETTGHGGVAASRRAPPPGPKAKVTAAEPSKQSGKAKAKSGNAGEAGKVAIKPDRQAVSTRRGDARALY